MCNVVDQAAWCLQGCPSLEASLLVFQLLHSSTRSTHSRPSTPSSPSTPQQLPSAPEEALSQGRAGLQPHARLGTYETKTVLKVGRMLGEFGADLNFLWEGVVGPRWSLHVRGALQE